jgi:WD40 repeat protein
MSGSWCEAAVAAGDRVGCPDGKRIVTVSADKTARLWDVATGEQIGEPFIGHSDTVSSAAFSSDGRRILTAPWDNTARLWDVDSRGPVAVYAIRNAS